jgi:DNA-binding MarR family transcriptional regulator
MSSATENSSSLPRRLRDGLERIAAVLRADKWRAIEQTALNPTQAQILDFLTSQGQGGSRVTAIAEHLRVSQPTATDSIATLEKKGLVARCPDPTDRRATTIAPTETGREAATAISAQTTATDRALAALDPSEQTALLTLVVMLIRNLQRDGAIAPQRMCVACRFFRPHAHDDARAPHHCDYVDAAFGPSALRLDCKEQEMAEPSAQEAAWRIFESGPDATGRAERTSAL